jgi:hypothetical protein
LGGHRRGHFDVVIVDEYAFVAEYNDRLTVFGISDPTHPDRLGSAEPTYSGNPHDIAVRGHYAYVADGGGGLLIVDVSDPVNPVTAGSLGVGTWGASGVDLFGDYAVVSDNDTEILHVVDITDPADPQEVGAAIDGGGFCVKVAGKYAYCTASPEHPVVIGSLDSPGYATDLVFSGPYAHVANGPSGLWITDVAYDPVAVEGGETLLPEKPALTVWRNPARSRVRLALPDLQRVPLTLEIFDPAGRLVRRLADGTTDGAGKLINWHGRPADGRLLPQGSYAVRLSWSSRSQLSRLVLLR